MADIQQLSTALKNADAAGDTEAARKIAAALRNAQGGTDAGATSAPTFQGSGGGAQPGEQPPDLQTPAVRNLPEMFTSGLLSGEDPMKVAQFAALSAITPNEQELAQVATNLFPEMGVQQDEAGNVILSNPRNNVTAMVNKPGPSMTDAAQFLGLGTAFNPAARAGATGVGLTRQGLKQTAKGATAAGGTQAGIEGAQAASGGEFDAADVGLAAGLQPAASAVSERVLSPGVRAIRGQPSERSRTLVQAGEEAGVPVKTTDVFPPKGVVGGLSRQFAERVPLLGTGGVRRGQKKARDDLATAFAESVPPVDDRAIIQSLQAKKQTIKDAAANRYQRIAEQMDAAGPVEIDKTVSTIDSAIDNLSRPGKVPDDSTIRDLQQLKQVLTENPQNFTLLRENRTYLSDLIEKTDAMGKSQMPTNSKRLLTQIRSAMTKDMDEFVKNTDPQTFNKYKNADAIYSREAQKLTKSRLKNVLDKGDITPENYQTLLFSSKPSEQKALHDSLTNTGRANARTAILNRIVERAGGPNDITPGKMNRELKKYSSAIQTFFKGKDREQMQGLGRLLEATRRADEAAAITPTGQSLQSMALVGAGAGAALQNPYAIAAAVLGGTAGAAARIYESRAVRDLMIRLKDTPKGSPAEQTILQQLIPVINSTAQAVRETAGDEIESTAATPQGS